MAVHERKLEPWPIGLAVALMSMIGVCICFWSIAVANPDAEIRGAGSRPGVVEGEARGGG